MGKQQTLRKSLAGLIVQSAQRENPEGKITSVWVCDFK
jgi:hypothetical protein